MIVRLGSTNPLKVRATERAFRLFFRIVRVVPAAVSRAVGEYPIGLEAIVEGARARARAAAVGAGFAVGIEAGLFRHPALGRREYLISVACVRRGRRSSLGSSPFFSISDKGLLRRAGEAGAIGLLTRGRITREDITRDAVAMALSALLF